MNVCHVRVSITVSVVHLHCLVVGILEGDEILSVNNIDIERAEDDIVDLQNALTGTTCNKMLSTTLYQVEPSITVGVHAPEQCLNV